MNSTTDAERLLQTQLNDAQFDHQRPDLTLALQVFRTFASQQFDCAEDAFLFQCGVYDFTGKREYQVDLVRQFVFEEDGEYDHMEQLHCTIYFAPTPELNGLEAELWSYDFPSPSEFFDHVSTMPGYLAAIDGRVPLRAETFQEEV